MLEREGGLKRLRLVVTGRVQGVGFRYFAYQYAVEKGLTGRAFNRPDGAVEIEVQGPLEVVEGFVMIVRRGPDLAAVEAVETETLQWNTGEDSFKFF